MPSDGRSAPPDDRSWADDEDLTKRQREAYGLMLREQARLGRPATAVELGAVLGIGRDGAYSLMDEVTRLGYATRVKVAGRTGPGSARLAVEARLSRTQVMAESFAASRAQGRRAAPEPTPPPPDWVGEHTLDLSGAQIATVVNTIAEWRRLRDPYASDGDALAGIAGEWKAADHRAKPRVAARESEGRE